MKTTMIVDARSAYGRMLLSGHSLYRDRGAEFVRNWRYGGPHQIGKIGITFFSIDLPRPLSFEEFILG